MAKAMKMPDSRQMEEELGYSAQTLSLTGQTAGRCYADLKPVPDDVSMQLMKEYLESKRTSLGEPQDAAVDFPRHGDKYVIDGRDSKVFIAQTDRVGLYKISVDIVFEHRLSLALLFTEAEARRTLRNWRFSTSHRTDQGPPEAPRTDAGQQLDKGSPLFQLPTEVREDIYSFAVPSRDLFIRDVQVFSRHTFPTALGDSTGFFFQLGQEPGVLQVNRQMRQEALPFAYRNTNFKLDDMDDLIRLLIAVGQIGRDNITSLQFPWTSRTEMAHRWEVSPNAGDNDTRLPNLHVPSCIELLRLCKRLDMLRICLEGDVIEENSETQFVTDTGLTALVALRVRSFEFTDPTEESLKEHRSISRLREKSQT